ncbi:hypothetical protein GCM10027060_15080 [Nesterenkonia halophila]
MVLPVRIVVGTTLPGRTLWPARGVAASPGPPGRRAAGAAEVQADTLIGRPKRRGETIARLSCWTPLVS